MIVTDTNTSNMDRKPAPPPSAPAAPPARDVQPPPEYARAHQSLIPHYVIDPHEQLHVGREAKKRAACRFFKAFAVAAAIWFLLGAVTHSIVRGVHLGHGYWDLGNVKGPTREDGHIVSCLDGYTWTHDDKHRPRGTGFGQKEVSKTFELPLDSELLYFLSRGSYSHGGIDIVPVESDGDVAIVEIKATYSHDEIIEASKVCLLSRHEKKHGLGIYTPERSWPSWPSYRLRWDVKVSVPVGTDLKALATTLRIFTHNVNGKGLKFGTLALSSTNAHMELDSVVAETATIATTNAKISGSITSNTTVLNTTNGKIFGSYNSTSSIFLRTTNGQILVDAHLTNTGGSSSHPSAILETTNGQIDSSVSLHSTSKDTEDDTFVVSARTSNSPLHLSIPTLPVDAQLSVVGHTTNSRASADIHPAFEGVFVASTTNGRVMLNTPDAKDPRGDGRKRKIENVYWNKKRTQVTGNVRWDEKRKEARSGSVALESTNGNIELTL